MNRPQGVQVARLRREILTNTRSTIWRLGAACMATALSLSLGCDATTKQARRSAANSAQNVLGPITSRPLPIDRVLAPSNKRDWIPEQKKLPSAKIDGDIVKVRNIRNCDHITENDLLVRYYDREFDLRELESVDFVVSPFQGTESLAHTMLSFGFANGDYLVSSVEARLEQGEVYSPVAGAARQYELMYVLADERDVIRLRTEVRGAEVYVYRSTATPAQARELFLDVLARVNKLAKHPEFYDTLTNNCTSNIVDHINRLKPNRVPLDHRVLLPGFSPEYAYELGLIENTAPFPEVQRRARVNDLAHRYKDSADFSRQIRR